VPTPFELIAAVLSGWASMSALTTVGFDGVPAVIVGILVFSTVVGTYRRRPSGT
jgi:hypothetical protein